MHPIFNSVYTYLIRVIIIDKKSIGIDAHYYVQAYSKLIEKFENLLFLVHI